jgi:hypothetical protein
VGGRGLTVLVSAAALRGRRNCSRLKIAAAHSIEQGRVSVIAATLEACACDGDSGAGFAKARSVVR